MTVTGKNNCTFHLKPTEQFQQVATENYPNLYPSDVDCVYIVQSEAGDSVQVVVEELETEECCDFAEVLFYFVYFYKAIINLIFFKGLINPS